MFFLIPTALLSGCGGVIRGLSQALNGALPDDFGAQIVVRIGTGISRYITGEHSIYMWLLISVTFAFFIYKQYRK